MKSAISDFRFACICGIVLCCFATGALAEELTFHELLRTWTPEQVARDVSARDLVLNYPIETEQEGHFQLRVLIWRVELQNLELKKTEASLERILSLSDEVIEKNRMEIERLKKMKNAQELQINQYLSLAQQFQTRIQEIKRRTD